MGARGDRKSPLRVRREGLGISRERLAAQLDPPVAASTIRRWEDGETKPRGYQLLQLERIFASYEQGEQGEEALAV